MSKHQKETWASAFKALGLRAISTGKFMQFVFLCVVLLALWTTKSEDKVRITSELVAVMVVYLLYGVAQRACAELDR